MTSRTAFRAITVVALATTSAFALGACSGGPDGGASARPSASATGGPVGTAVEQRCDDLVPQATFAVYGKSFTLDRDAEPAKGSPAALIAGQRGRVCVFVDTANDVRITLAVAHLPEKTLTSLKDGLYEESNSVPTYGVEGYFRKAGSIGRADAFVDPYWVNVRSTMFGEPGDAEPVMDAVRAALDSSTSDSAAPTAPASAPAG